MGILFERMAMDIVGPLPRSRSGNRYILVVCDYATQYPEAVPMRSIDAELVAEELVKLFVHVGIPREILTDQGSNFTSRLPTEIYRLLQVHPIRTTPYHPQTDGLMEQFNKILKSLLQKVTKDTGKDWDKLLPYLPFAYREVPQASTGFFPFELLCGRPVRGPLDILVIRETWEASPRSTESVVSHALVMRDKLASMTQLVKANLQDFQTKQKCWYDRTARERTFEPGDLVLVLLPTKTSKLRAKWQGPYQVLRREGTVNYLIDLHDTRRRKRMLHVNMLKPWYAPLMSFYTEASHVEESTEDYPEWSDDGVGRPKISEQQMEVECRELGSVLTEFTDVLRSQPGRTSLVAHRINSATVHRLPPAKLHDNGRCLPHGTNR